VPQLHEEPENINALRNNQPEVKWCLKPAAEKNEPPKSLLLRILCIHRRHVLAWISILAAPDCAFLIRDRFAMLRGLLLNRQTASGIQTREIAKLHRHPLISPQSRLVLD
jgi:hypothetical protein